MNKRCGENLPKQENSVFVLTRQGRRDSISTVGNEDSQMDSDNASKLRRLNILLDADLHKELRVRTVIECKPISAIITDALNSYFEKTVKREAV